MSCSEEPDIEGPEYMLRPASFSVQTCLELINSGALSIHQINRESKLLLHPKIIEALPEVPVTRSISSFLDKTNPKGPLPAALEARQTFLIDKLKQFFECLIDDNFVDFRKGISTLTFNLARDVQDANKRASEASAQLENLKKNIQEAQELVESLNTRVTEAAPPPQLSSTPQRETVTIVSEPPYKILESRDLFSRFEVSSLRDEFVFDGLFSNRGTAYYGDVPYKYPGGSHPARRLPSTSLSTQFIGAVKQLCVENKLRFEDYNSCMITLYEGPESCIPAHSDNEPSLIPDSSILTVSIGGTRNIQFRQRSPGQTRITLESQHGSCYLMTRSSQDLFTHEVLKPTVDSSPRMSFTFRSLRPATSAQSAPSAPQKRERGRSTPLGCKRELRSHLLGLGPAPLKKKKNPARNPVSMDKLPIDEIITQLDSKDIKERTSAIQIVNSSISENDQVLTLLIEQYFVSYSENVMHIIISLMTESRAQLLYDALYMEFERLPSHNLKPTLVLLTTLLRYDTEPTWMYLFVGHPLLNEMLASFKTDQSTDCMPLGLVFLSMLLPLAPLSLESSLDDLFSLLDHVITVYYKNGGKPWELIQRICFHYMVTLYSMYPVKLITWAQTLDGTTPAGLFVLKYGRILRLHAALLQPASSTSGDDFEGPHSLADRESHDIVWEVSCFTEPLDLLYEAKMIAGVKEGEVTEMHDISWECVASTNASRSIACQTSDATSTKEKSEVDTISDSLISTYLEKTLVSSAGMVQRRKNSHRFEHDNTESSQSALEVLEGELMLEKYLRFQHERRNRRYLSQVRQSENQRSYYQVYKDEWERLKTELATAETKVAELTLKCEAERNDSQQQLFVIEKKLNEKMAVLSRRNHELERNEKESSSKMEELQKQLGEKTTRLLDLEGIGNLMAEKQKQIDVVTEHNKTLIKKVKQLQNQVFLLNEIRSSQCDALNALKPFCYKIKSNSPYHSPAKEITPDIANLTKLASETQRKFENVESEVKRLRSKNSGMEDEIAVMKEKLAKQKILTEKTTNFWEQKYSGLEKTCATYKSTYNEMCQKVLRLKRELEQRSF
ncbi:hypothetical protein ACHWQZ_G019092 [Mnemiopsis leidyi]